MKKIVSVLVLVLVLVFFSCNKKVVATKEVKPTLENITAIVNSDKYVIKIDVVSGNIAGSYTDQIIIKIDDYKIDFKGKEGKFSKEVSKFQKDALKNILIRLTRLHDEEKIPLKHGDCVSSDENYTIENSSMKMRVKPKFGNLIYSEIMQLIHAKRRV